MKKSFTFFILALLLIFGATVVMPQEVFAKKDLSAGTVIKGKGLSTLYYLGEDGKRYVFPNAKTYFSWFDDFSEVEEIELEDLYEYNLGGNARYKPGKFLIKITTDPKVYAVGADGILRWVKTENIAKHFYGNNWNKMIDDVPDSFFTNYTVGDPIEGEEDFNPEETEEEVPTISHNRGWKAKEKIKNKIQNVQERRCRFLKNAVNNLQKRAEKWGIEMPDLGDDYMSECVADSTDDDNNNGNGNGNGNGGGSSHTPVQKITICHKGKTISVAGPALKAHIKHGDYIGECTGNDTGNNDDDGDDDGDDPDEVDETAPVISDINAVPGATSATFTWTTDEESTSEVEYSTESIASSTTTSSEEHNGKVTDHSLEVSGLTPETTYYYIVRSTDAAGNTTVSEEGTFTTEAEDTTAPVISDIVATPGFDTATITWTTDEEADSTVEYATESVSEADTTDEAEDETKVTSHSVELTGLTPETTYYYTVKSKDASGNTTVSDEGTFTTDPEPDTTAPEISNLVTSPTATSSTITWDTNESATFKFTYAAESLNIADISTIIEVENTTLGTSHSVTLNGLSANTEYFFKVEVTDEAGNTTEGTETSFTTTQ